MKCAQKIVAGKPMQVGTRNFVPIFRSVSITLEHGRFSSAEPIAVYVLEGDLEYYFQFAGEDIGPDISAISGIARSMNK